MIRGQQEDTGIIIVQHGDFPFDFHLKEPELFEFVERMLEKLGEDAREIDRKVWQDPFMEDTEKLAATIRAKGVHDLEIGYLDFCRPTIDDAVQKLVKRGIDKIIFVNGPSILMRSSHSLTDVPKVLKLVAARHEGVAMVYGKPGITEGVVQGLIKKIKYGLGEPIPAYDHENRPLRLDGYGVVLIGHGDVPPDYIRANASAMEQSEKHVAMLSKMMCGMPRTEANDPLYYDSIKLADMVKCRGGFKMLEVASMEFARPSIDDVVEQMVGKGVKRILFVGGSGFFDRSSHTLIDIPEAMERQQRRWPGIKMDYVYPNMGFVAEELSDAVIEKIIKADAEGTRIN